MVAIYWLLPNGGYLFAIFNWWLFIGYFHVMAILIYSYTNLLGLPFYKLIVALYKQNLITSSKCN